MGWLFYTSYYSGLPSDRWLFLPQFLFFYGPGPFYFSFCIPAFGLVIFCYYTVFHGCCSWGPFLGFLLVSSGVLPEWDASVI